MNVSKLHFIKVFFIFQLTLYCLITYSMQGANYAPESVRDFTILFEVADGDGSHATEGKFKVECRQITYVLTGINGNVADSFGVYVYERVNPNSGNVSRVEFLDSGVGASLSGIMLWTSNSSGYYQWTSTGVGLDNVGGQYGTFSVTNTPTDFLNIDWDLEQPTLLKCQPQTIGPVIIPNGVEIIGNFAFFGCKFISSVSVPDSLISIGDNSFANCIFLTSITIPNSVTSIGSGAFSDCSNLTSITIPDSVTSIGRGTFSGCSNLTSITIPNSLTSIGSGAFSDCSNLTSITIPDSVTSIGSDAFSGCSNLTSITIPDSVTSIGQDAFQGCTGLTSIVIPEAFHTQGEAKRLSLDHLWSNSDGMLGPLTYEVTDGQITITHCDLNFSGSIEIPTKIDLSFNYEPVRIPVTTIAERAFYSCISLTSVTIPEGVTSIGNNAFSGCSSLTSITIPDSVTSIGDDAFAGCKNLTSIIIPKAFHTQGEAKRLSLDHLWNNSDGKLGPLTYEVTDGQITIIYCDPKFSGAIEIPTTIDLSLGYELPVTSIRGRAFSGCSMLTSITIPDSVTNIGAGAFSDCRSLNSINVTSGNSSYKAVDGIIFSKDGKDLLNYPNAKSSTYAIPDGVTRIGDQAFSGCVSLTSITIPEGVTSIGNSAFSGCWNLTSITIPDSVTNIGDFAFHLCGSLTSVEIGGGATTIGDRAFNDCSSLTSVEIRDGATTIGERAFSGCSMLPSIAIPDSVTSIGNGAFSGCSNLTSITIPDSVKTIRDYTFAECSSLESITIPDGVISFGNEAFRNCTSLTSVTVPESVVQIRNGAFRNCSSLISVTIPDSVNNIGDSVFVGCTSLTFAIVPEKYHNKSMAEIIGLGELWPDKYSIFSRAAADHVLSFDNQYQLTVIGEKNTMVLIESTTDLKSNWKQFKTVLLNANGEGVIEFSKEPEVRFFRVAR